MLAAAAGGMFLTSSSGGEQRVDTAGALMALPQPVTDQAEATQQVPFFQWSIESAVRLGRTERVLGPVAAKLGSPYTLESLQSGLSITWVPSSKLVTFAYSGTSEAESLATLDEIMKSFAANALAGLDTPTVSNKITFVEALAPTTNMALAPTVSASKQSKSMVTRVVLVGGLAVVAGMGVMVAADLVRRRRTRG